VLEILWSLCRGQGTPADLPASVRFVNLALAAYAASTLLALVIFRGAAYAFPVAFLSAALLGLSVWAIVHLKGFPARVPQTIGAVAGTGTLMNLAVLPIYMLVVFGGLSAPAIAILVNIAAVAWSLVVVSHIFREALSERVGPSVGFALIYHLAMLFGLALFDPLLSTGQPDIPAATAMVADAVRARG